MFRTVHCLPYHYTTVTDMVDRGHGSPYDRGGADSYYRRPFDPHWWPAGTYKGFRIEMPFMSAEQIEEYKKGFDQNESDQNFKDWG